MKVMSPLLTLGRRSDRADTQRNDQPDRETDSARESTKGDLAAPPNIASRSAVRRARAFDENLSGHGCSCR
jgi:hypothetical protein